MATVEERLASLEAYSKMGAEDRKDIKDALARLEQALTDHRTEHLSSKNLNIRLITIAFAAGGGVIGIGAALLQAVRI